MGASEVACLVRAQPGLSASERFQQALVENRLEHLDLSRVRVHAADITQPRLGLSDALYEEIDAHYGALIHNAAQVNHVLDYDALAATNVEPVFHCLRLCEGRRKKIFNFVSTYRPPALSTPTVTCWKNRRPIPRPSTFAMATTCRNG